MQNTPRQCSHLVAVGGRDGRATAGDGTAWAVGALPPEKNVEGKVECAGVMACLEDVWLEVDKRRQQFIFWAHTVQAVHHAQRKLNTVEPLHHPPGREAWCG